MQDLFKCVNVNNSLSKCSIVCFYFHCKSVKVGLSA